MCLKCSQTIRTAAKNGNTVFGELIPWVTASTIKRFRTVVVAQLAEQSLPVSEDHGSNPGIDKRIFMLNINYPLPIVLKRRK